MLKLFFCKYSQIFNILILLFITFGETIASYIQCPNSDITAGCSNLDFTYHAQNTNIPPATISITNVVWLGGDNYQVTINFKSLASMSLSSLSELKIIGLSQIYYLYSYNMWFSEISDPGEWDATVTVTSPNLNGKVWMPTNFQIQFDWCSEGVWDRFECSQWRYAQSYDYITGCNNHNNYGQSQTDSSGYYWPAYCDSRNYADTTSSSKSTSPTTTTTPNNNNQNTVAPNSQCGGFWYYGPTGCTAGYTCSTMNIFYAACVSETAKISTTSMEKSSLTTTSAALPTTSASSKPTSTSRSAPTANDQVCVGGYAQCGGLKYTGASCCVSGYYCSSMNDYYYQCIPGTTTTYKSSSTTTPSRTITTSSSSTKSLPTPTTVNQNCIAPYGQCGGLNYIGAKCCVKGFHCSSMNDYYHQCVGGDPTTSNTPTTSRSPSTTLSTTSSTSSSTGDTSLILTSTRP